MSQRRFLSGRLTLLVLSLMLIPLLLAACGNQKNNVTPTFTPGTAVSAGSWTAFTNANNVNGLAIRGNEVWWATSGGVVKLNPSDGSYVKYTTVDGLISNNVLAVAKDHEGNLWFGTDMGVMCYDGSVWQTYTTADGLANDSVSTIAVDRNDNIWCGSYLPMHMLSSIALFSNGISCYDGKEWHVYNEKAGLVSNFVHTIVADEEGNVWFGSLSGASRYDGKKWQTYNTEDGLASNFILDIATDRNGRVWFNTDKGVNYYDGKSWYTYITTGEPAKNTSSFSIWPESRRWEMTIDRNGNLWIGGEEDNPRAYGGYPNPNGYDYQGVGRYDGETWHYYTTADGLASKNIRAIEEDTYGNLWFATDRGVNCYDGKGWRTYVTTVEPACDTLITSIAEDHQGNSWFGSSVGGIVCYNGTEWLHYTTEDGLANNMVSAITVGLDGTVWFGTRSGISCYDGKTWQSFKPTFTTYYGLSSDNVNHIAVDKSGNIFAGTDDGIVLYDGTTWNKLDIADDLARTMGSMVMVIDRTGNLWFSSNGHVYRYDIKLREISYTSDFTSAIGEIAVDSENNLWVVTYRGVKRYDGHNWHDVAVPYGKSDMPVTALFIDKDDVKWFAILGQGVSRYDGKTWQTFTTRNGLANNNVRAIAQDKEGNLWFGTDSGISRYSP